MSEKQFQVSFVKQTYLLYWGVLTISWCSTYMFSFSLSSALSVLYSFSVRIPEWLWLKLSLESESPCLAHKLW